MVQRTRRLNPCFNGRYSQRIRMPEINYKTKSLNPCFNGRYSQRGRRSKNLIRLRVLILVLMEDTLRVSDSTLKSVIETTVLILVLMEDTLREKMMIILSKTVLILVLMEDTLREQRLMFLYIPVFGVCSSF